MGGQAMGYGKVTHNFPISAPSWCFVEPARADERVSGVGEAENEAGV